jgi:two-component system cell cycle sensor histidine kinase/response regulator CckA
MEKDSFRGILTAADISQSPHQLVIDCINPKPPVESNEDIEAVLEVMRDSGEFVLPVFKDSEFIGVVVQKNIRDYMVDYQRDLERNVTEQTQELSEVIDRLRKETEECIRTEKALRDSEEEYRTLIESTLDIIFKVDRKGYFTYVNPRFEEVVGYCLDELIGRPFTYVVAPEQIESTVNRFKDGIKGKKVLPYEADLIHKNGGTIPVEFQVTTLYDSNGSPAGRFGVGRDLTERKRAEEERQRLETQVQRAQKMEAIGTLAGGIAHDFNNLLMGIQGNVSLAILGMDSANPLYERLKNIEQQVRSGADLTRQLLGFARGGKYEVRPSNLSEIMEKSSMLFGRTKKEIHIHRKYQEDIWTVDVDQGQIEQVLLNLYVNAWQAMPGGGELYLEAENVTLAEDYVKPYNLESGRYVKMSVTDTGVGMDEATLRRIFDPFFTTKEMGRGTGLGLASAYGIIQNHGGIINVYSEKGLGTTFNVYLPISDKKIMDEKKSSEEILLGTETVLLVDDEGIIADVGTEMLQMMGYDVFVARDGREALMLYDENRDRIDMVILDMIMPEMSGGETFDRLKENNPEIKVLLSSGYSLNGRAKDIINRGCKGFIQKPFSVKELSHKIRDVLDNQ